MKTSILFTRSGLAAAAVMMLLALAGCCGTDKPEHPGPHQSPAADGKDLHPLGHPGPHQGQ